MTEPFTPDQVFISKLTDIILVNLENENFGVKELVRMSGLSHYSLVRKLHSINKKTVNQFIVEVRLQKAFEMLQKGDYSAAEVAFKTGFGSPSYFNKCFNKHFGYPPGKIKKGDLKNPEQSTPLKNRVVRFLPAILLMGIVFIPLIYLGYREIQKPASDNNLISPDSRISVVVMPFQNMTNDTLWDIWQEGIQTNLISSLSDFEELKVRQIETINGYLKIKNFTNYSSITPSVAGTISQKLEATVCIYGNIIQAGTTVRLSAQLINSKTQEILKSFRIDGTSGEILDMADSISVLTSNFLIISKLDNENPSGLQERFIRTTNSPEAYRYFIQGNKAFYENDFSAAIELYEQAFKIDSNLVGALSKISLSYYNDGNIKNAKYWCLRHQTKRAGMNLINRIWADFVYALLFKTPMDRIKCMEKLKEMDEQNPMAYFNAGDAYLEIFKYEEAIDEFEKAFKIFHQLDSKPYWGAFYYELGIAYHKSGKYREEKKLYKSADKDFPDDPGLMDQHAWLAFTTGDSAKANGYIKKWTAAKKKESWSDARIATYLAYVYDMAHDTQKVEVSLRRALSLEPENPARMSSLANFLIDFNRDINEGMILIEKAIVSDPDNYSFLHNKGWGLYKQENYMEALRLLQKSWDLRMLNSIYNHKAFLHLGEAKKAAAGII